VSLWAHKAACEPKGSQSPKMSPFAQHAQSCQNWQTSTKFSDRDGFFSALMRSGSSSRVEFSYKTLRGVLRRSSGRGRLLDSNPQNLWNLPSLYGPVVATSLTPSQVADNDGDETADHRLSTVPRRVVSSRRSVHDDDTVVS